MAFSDRLQLKIRGQRQPNDSNSLAEALTNSIWGESPTTASKQAHSFLRYWDSHCSPIDSEDAIVKTRQDILDIIAFVRDNRLLTLDTLRQELVKVQPKWLGKTDDAAERAIEIAVRLWLFVEIDDWDDSMTLAEFIEESFRRSASTTEGVVLPDSFMLETLRRLVDSTSYGQTVWRNTSTWMRSTSNYQSSTSRHSCHTTKTRGIGAVAVLVANRDVLQRSGF